MSKYRIVSLNLVVMLVIFNIQINSQPELRNIYIIKNYWHTGIIIQVDSTSIRDLPVLNLFSDFQSVDIGFGDRVFFLHPSNDMVLAARAILVPTESTIRIAKAYSTEEELIRSSDYVVKLKFGEEEIRKLCEFINNSLSIDEFSKTKIIDRRAENMIIFFESERKYHLFNTCNTWVAKALKAAGLEDINPANVVTSKDLFKELLIYGEILKIDESDSLF